jgi:hypothetical protein
MVWYGIKTKIKMMKKQKKLKSNGGVGEDAGVVVTFLD